MASRSLTPITSGYRHNIYITHELGMEDLAYFHTIVGVLRWIVELEIIAINVEASVLSSHLVIPREGHFQELLQYFAYLNKHMNTEMVFDLSEPDIDMDSFHRQDWSYSIYSLLGEEIRGALPPNMP